MYSIQKPVLIVGIFILLLYRASISFAQISGNQVYGNSSNNNVRNAYNIQKNGPNASSAQRIIVTDTTISIRASVLINQKASAYQLVVGVQQQELTAGICNKNINNRIKSLKQSLLKSGILAPNIYVDFVAQAEIFDYDVKKSEDVKLIEQNKKGYEIKKNVIITFIDLTNVDHLISLCAKEEIYDIIKVDYLDSQRMKTYAQLLEESWNIVKERKAMYSKLMELSIDKKPLRLNDQFNVILPKTQYKKYNAFESTDLSYWYRNSSEAYIKKEARKKQTFYYNGMEAPFYDKTINTNDPTIGIQYTMELVVTYKLKTNS